jgi:GAF domain-containing protein
MIDPVVLVVDPDVEAREAAADRVRETTGFDVRTVETVAAAERTLDAHRVECVVTEYDLPGGTGFDLLDRVRETTPDAGCIVYTDRGRAELPTAEAPRVAEFLSKDVASLDRLATLVETTVSARSQTAYPLPDGEADRLAALESYDFDSERLRAALDRVAALAADHFGVPTATINILDRHTQRFVGCHGADWPPIRREASICAHAIVDETPVTVVEDTAADPRFRDNQTIVDLGIGFYAGADLTTDAGITLGTLCVYQEDPRTFDADDRRYLRLLADEATHLLEVHRDLGEAETRDGSAGARG